MARRSARLQKRSPSPGSSSNPSWETAESRKTPQPERLPSVFEGYEPTVAATKTPNKQAVGIEPNRHTTEKLNPASQLPQLSSTTTPLKTKSSMSNLMAAITSRTPKNRTPIKPAGEEMHPQQHHATTAKWLDEARWLGFQQMGSKTVPPKATQDIAVGQMTPSKTPGSVPTQNMKILPSPEFRFRFRSPIAGLSPKSNHILQGGDLKDTVAGGRPLFGADEFSAPADVSPRKMAVPKGKSNRFSDVHMAEFKKMDSIANHPSAFRADPNRFKAAHNLLKKSPSKMDVSRPEPARTGPNKLKRTQSKMDVTESAPKPPVSKLVATPLKRARSKIDLTQPNSSQIRPSSTLRLVPPSRHGLPGSRDGDAPAKRVKRTETDDAATTRPILGELPVETPKSKIPARPLPRPNGMSRLMTPTKSSMMRSQSAKTLKSTSMLPSLLKSSSAKALFSPTNIGQAMKNGMQEGIRKTGNSLHRVRSILRTPSRKFSEDPEKIAAGTHMSTPPGLDIARPLPQVPVTAPVKKHVNFTTSTLERDTKNEFGKSPSPMKIRAGSEMPSGAVIYPTLQSCVEYPTLPEDQEVGSPTRRLTFGGATDSTPANGQFNFKSEKSINFGPTTKGTIRMVRKSDVSSFTGDKKRKLDTTEETSDKENTTPVDEGRSPAKRARTTTMEPPKTPASTSKLPRRTPNRGVSITKSRLAFLATPRRSKA